MAVGLMMGLGTLAGKAAADRVQNIKKQAEESDIAFLFKQWGTWSHDGIKRNKHVNGKLLDGKVIQQMPKERKR